MEGKENLVKSFDIILTELEKYSVYQASILICNVVNTHIKNVNKEMIDRDKAAEEAENSMEALADSLRTLRLMAKKNIDEHRDKVVRLV